jgi:hypothetical protein|tara:strand:+ start:743 stop:970 length:228 start_codon:yes stop_codon:yes gene_type:complete
MDFNYIELIGWFGFLFIAYGYFLNAKKQFNCFYVWGIGNVIFSYYAVLINSYPMFFMSILTIGMNIYGWYKWNKD